MTGFPTPSSSLFTPPEEGDSIASRLDDRVAAAKADKLLSSAAGEHHSHPSDVPHRPANTPLSPAEAASSSWRNSYDGSNPPTRPTSRASSRPPSFTRPASVGSRLSLEDTKRGSTGSVKSIAEGEERAGAFTAEEREETNDDNAAPEEAAAAQKPDVVVRDFAFQRDDPRFDGVAMPMDERRGSTTTDLSGAEDSPQMGGYGSEGGAGSFSWGFVTSHGQPAQFGDEEEDEEEDEDVHAVPEVFVPGVYQAVYDFEPELDTEMRMRTGDVVSVWDRQCDGWVSPAFLSLHTAQQH